MTDITAITKEERALAIDRLRDAAKNNKLFSDRRAFQLLWKDVGVALAALAAVEKERDELREALNERNLFSNPDFIEEIADEIDCERSCENIWWESDTNASGCRVSERGDYCPNDLAETLRAVAKVARAALKGRE